MTNCSYCGRGMGKQECQYDHVFINGGEYKRVRVVESPFHPGKPSCECGCEIGEVHHAGCDLEECPRCGGQFLSCLFGGEDDSGCTVGDFFYFRKP